MAETRKTLYDRFGRYEPLGIHKVIYDKAYVDSMKLDRERRIVEVKISLSELFDKEDIYSLEKALCETYGLALVRILTRYPQTDLLHHICLRLSWKRNA